MLSLALIIPIRSNSPFPPLFCYGEESPKWEETKERPGEPAVIDRSTEGKGEHSECPHRLTVRQFLPPSLSLSFPCLPFTLDDDDSGYHRRRNICAMTRRAHFTRARPERKRREEDRLSTAKCVRVRLHARVRARGCIGGSRRMEETDKWKEREIGRERENSLSAGFQRIFYHRNT